MPALICAIGRVERYVHHLHTSGDHVGDGGDRAAIRHMHELQPGEARQLLSADLRQAAGAGRSVIDLARIGTRIGEELLERLGGNVCAHHQQLWRFGEHRDWQQVLERVERQAGVQEAADDIAGVDGAKRVAVRRRVATASMPTAPPAPGRFSTITGLPGRAGDVISGEPADEIGDAACGGRHDHLDRLRRKSLRDRRQLASKRGQPTHRG